MKKLLSHIIALILLPLLTLGQANEFNVIPPSPNAANLGKYGDMTVNHSTGTLNFSIPLYTIEEGDIKWPISLQYTSTGYKPMEPAGWVGRGWVLNGGGVITRTVRGLHDDISAAGFLDKAVDVENALDDIQNSIFSSTGQLINNLITGSVDTEPDLYHFNFAGYSGKFFYGQDGEPHIVSNRDIKIEMNLPVQAWYDNGRTYHHSIKSFTLTTEDGTKYIFDEREYSKWEFSGNGSQYTAGPSAWHLTEVISNTGRKLVLTYTTLGNTESCTASIVESGMGPVCTNCEGGGTIYNMRNGLQYYFSEERFLQSIEVENGFSKVDFFSTLTSESVGSYTSSSRILDSLVITNDLSNETLKKVNLIIADNEWLTQVQEYDSFGKKISPYFLTYANPSISGITLQTDMWGYANGAYFNTTSIPIFGANRLPNPDEAYNGMLNTVYYPTGEYITFGYELNDFSFTTDGNVTDDLIVTEYYNYQYRAWDSQHFDNDPVITVTNDSEYKVTYSYIFDPYGSPSCCVPSSSTTCSGTYPDNDGTLNANTNYDGNFFVDATTISNIESNSPGCTNLLVISANVEVRHILKHNESFGPGVRIVHIKQNDVDGNTLVKTYTYKKANDPSKSSGGLNRVPVFSDVAYFYAFNNLDPYFFYKNEPITNIGQPQVIYEHVTETISDAYLGFETTSFSNSYEFTSFSFPNLNINYINIPAFQSVGVEPIGNQEDYDFSRGALISSKNFDDHDILRSLKEVDYYYHQLAGPGLQTNKEYKAPSFYYEYLVNIPPTVPNGPGSGPPAVAYFSKYYYTLSSFFEKKSELKIEYDENGQNPDSTYTTYQYDDLNHLQLSSSKFRKSNGDSLINYFKYPIDYSGVSNKANFIQALIDDHRVSDAIEKVTYLKKSASDSLVVDAGVTTFKTFPGNTNRDSLILPYRQYVFNGYTSGTTFPEFNGLQDQVTTANYHEAIRFEDYNTFGNILAVTRNENEKASYLWSYNNTYPVAEIKNADWSQVSSAISGAGTTVSALTNSTDDSFIESKLNAIRGSLTNSLVSSYLYKPMIGISRMISPNGLSTYYSYDSFNRLMEIKDHNEHIIKRYDYNVVNWPW